MSDLILRGGCRISSILFLVATFVYLSGGCKVQTPESNVKEVVSTSTTSEIKSTSSSTGVECSTSSDTTTK